MSKIDPDTIDRGILAALQGDLDDSPEPYARIATELGISEDEVIRRIRRLMDAGIIRRIGAMIRHFEAGIGFNAMVVWKVEPERIEEIGLLFAGLPEVTHCYERPPFGENGGTLFTMVHATAEAACMEIVRQMSRRAAIDEYEILFSERELKKISMTYFDNEDQQEDWIQEEPEQHSNNPAEGRAK
jgi:DNA-binding Lrp family transcriptional regulator